MTASKLRRPAEAEPGIGATHHHEEESLVGVWIRAVWHRVTRSGIILFAAIALSIGSFMTTMDGFYVFLSPKPSAPIQEGGTQSAEETAVDGLDQDLGPFLGSLFEAPGQAGRSSTKTAILTLTFTSGVQFLLYSISFLIGQNVVKSTVGAAGAAQRVQLYRFAFHAALIGLVAAAAWTLVWPDDFWRTFLAALGAFFLGLIVRFVFFSDRDAVTRFYLAAAYTIVLSLSSLFSFDAIYRFILTEEESKKEAQAVLLEEYPLLIGGIETELDQQFSDAWTRLTGSESFSKVSLYNDGLKSTIRHAGIPLQQDLEDRVAAMKGAGSKLSDEIAAKDAELTEVKGEIAALEGEIDAASLELASVQEKLAAFKSARDDEFAARGRPEEIEQRIRDATRRMQFEEEGLQDAEPGRGPKYIAARDDRRRAEAELKLVEQEVAKLQKNIKAYEEKSHSLSAVIEQREIKLEQLKTDYETLERAREELRKKRESGEREQAALTGIDPVAQWLRGLDDAGQAFTGKRDPRGADDFEDRCLRAEEALSSVSVPTPTSGACWYPDLDRKLAEARRLHSAAISFGKGCTPDGEGSATAVTRPLKEARNCFSLASIQGQTAIQISRRITELEAEYGGKPNLRRAISNFLRGDKFALSAASLALSIDLLILICGIISGLAALQYRPGRLDRLTDEEQFGLIVSSLAPTSAGAPSLSASAGLICNLLKPTKEDPNMFELQTDTVTDPAGKQMLSRFMTAARPIGRMITLSDGSERLWVPVRVLLHLNHLKAL